jgi:hypothetical protein
MTSRSTVNGPTATDGVPPMSERLLTQQQAAVLAGCSKDTIVRARRAGRFLHARLRDGRWTIPSDDLAAAGLYPHADVVPAPAEDRSDPGNEPASIELARAQARIGALEDLVARQDDELRFLRQLAADSLGRKAS